MDADRQIDRLCDSFKAEWKTGKPPDLEAWLLRIASQHRAALCRKLVPLDIEYHRKGGNLPDGSDYAPFGPDIVALAHAELNVPGQNSASGTDSLDASLVETHIISGHGLSTEDVSTKGRRDDGLRHPQKLGRYEIRERLGEGAFGRVWLAYDPELQRQVAVKEPKLDTDVSDKQLLAFIEEARRAAQLDHPHIVPVLDVGRTEDGVPFVVSKYVNGISLKERLRQDNVPLEETIRTVTAIASALHHAHTHGIIHRDVKPANILIDDNGTPFLTDFGLALLVTEQRQLRGEISGSPTYMSPEQARGLTHHLDGRADIWSLGVTLYEMLTGLRPFQGATYDDLFDEIITRDPRPPRQIRSSIPKPVEAICLQAIAKQVAQRFSTADDFQHQLNVCLPPAMESEPSKARSSTEPERLAFNIPQLPPCYVQREEHLTQIRTILLSQSSTTIGVTGAPLLGVQGRGGLGKTVIAAAAAHDRQIQEHFRDGTIWLTVGLAPNLPAVQRQLLKCLGITNPAFETPGEFRDQLQKLLQDRALLIVLDDVWETDHIRDFVCSSGAACFLITTRDGRVLTQLNATEYGLDVMSDDAALQLLADWSNESIQDLHRTADVGAVLRESGKLPLALSVCGAMKRDGHSWADIAEALRGSMLDFLDDDAHYNYRSVLNCLAVGVDFLRQKSPNDADRYLELAVFPSDVLIPEESISRFWSETSDLSPLKARRLLTTLHRRNLLTLRETDSGRAVECHDLQHEYLCLLAVEQNKMPRYHQALIDGYRVSDGNLPDDGYFFQHIVSHFLEAQQTEQCIELLHSVAWLSGKLTTCGLGDLLNELNLFRDRPQTRLLTRAIRLSSHAICGDTSQIFGQLQARIGDQEVPLKPDTIRTNELVPVTQSLTAPGSLLQTLRGPKGKFQSIDELPEKDRLIACQYDGTVIVWDLVSGQIMSTFTGPRRGIEWQRVSPDGRLIFLFYRGYGRIEAWDLETKQKRWQIIEHSAPVLDVCFSDEADTAVSCSADGSLVIWSVADGTVQTVLNTLHSPSAISRTDKVRELVSRWSFSGFAVSVRSVSFIKNSTDIVAIGAGELDDHFREMLSDSISMTIFKKENRCKVIAFDRTHRRVVTGGNGSKILVWEFDSLECLGVLRGHDGPIRCVAIDEANQHAVSGSNDATLIHWDLKEMKLLARMRGHSQEVRQIRYLSSPGLVASSSDDGTIKIWDLSVRESEASASDVDQMPTGRRTEESAHCDSITRIQVSERSRLAYSAARDGLILEHDLESGTIIRQIGERGVSAVRDIAVNSSGEKLVAIYEDGSIQLRQIRSARDVLVFSVELPGELRSVRFDSTEEKIIVACQNGDLPILNTVDGERIGLLYSPVGMRPHLVPGSQRIVTTGPDSSIRLTDLATYSQQMLNGHADSTTDMHVSEDGNMLISVGADLMLKVWDLDSMAQLGHSLHGHDRVINCCSLSRDKRRALTGDSDGRVVLWDLKEGKVIGEMRHGQNTVQRLLLVDDDRKAVTVFGDGTIRLWDLSTLSSIGAFTGDAEITDLAATAERVIAGDTIGFVHILKF